MTELLEKFRAWSAISDDAFLDEGVTDLVLYLSDKLFDDYEPDTVFPFLLRLENWLSNVNDIDDQKTLLSLLGHVFFAGRDEFESLSRTALSNIHRWIIVLENLNIADEDIDQRLKQQIACSWICPITDSLRINAFLKLNGLMGHDLRPDWRSLARFSDKKLIDEYCAENQIKRLVLLEDFVGSGSQTSPSIEFACDNFPNIQVLFSPLITCPTGDEAALDLEQKYSNLTYLPAMVLPESHFLGETATDGEPSSYANARSLIKRLATRSGETEAEQFGYQQTGALVVLFSNCPDNTLSLFRRETETWQPLFPRVWRPE